MRHLSLVLPGAPIHQAKANSDKYAERIGDPVVHFCAAVEGGLYEFNYAAKGTRADKHWQQPKPTSARKGKGQSRKGHEVYDFVTPLRRRGRRLKRPEHRDCQDGRDDNCEGDIEILAHSQRLSAPHARRKLMFRIGHFGLSRNPRTNRSLGVQISGES